MSAKVYLVGAGPGDPELLTRKAWRVLQSADVVLHDELVSEEILGTLPETSQIVNVGKRCGSRGISQPEINFWMVSLAREGKIVARLKSGDPTLFGRAGEEIEALRQAGVEFEIVPGVTAALGAAASAQISLTDRRHASRVVFVTAHRAGESGLSNERHVAADTTYVIYMPGQHYRELAEDLMAAGIGGEIPCVLISRATTDQETVQRATVGELARCAAAASPALLIVGAGVGETLGQDADPGQFSLQFRDELFSFAMQQTNHESYGRGDFE
jgi:uroporphyrin-III C-methyltransferase